MIAAGRLVDLVPEFRAPAMPVSSMLPHRRQLAPRVQAVPAWLTQVIAPQRAATP